MRDALTRSQADDRTQTTRHAPGDVVICVSCARPLFILERAINLGDKAGRAAEAFAPVTPAVIHAIAEAAHVDAGLRAWARRIKPTVAAYCDQIPRPKAGDLMICPHCSKAWIQVLTVERGDTLDLAYTLELVTVSLTGPTAPIRGRRLGAGKDWLH